MDAQLNPLFEKAVKERRVAGIGGIILDTSGQVLYKNTFGTLNINDPSAGPFTSSSPGTIFSCTKLVTSIAALQLLEQGKLALDDPVEKYLPVVSQLQVHDGVDENGKLKFREAKNKMTVLHLMTHTSGFTYDFFDPLTTQYRTEFGQPMSDYPFGRLKPFETPLLFDPGTGWVYGISTDWLGLVVEKASGLALDEYIAKHICEPLGLENTKAYGWFSEEGRAKMMRLHFRNPETGELAAPPEEMVPLNPERNMGGGYLYSSLDEYSQVFLTVLNYGTHPISKVKILDAATVKEYLFKDFVTPMCSNEKVGTINSMVPMMSNEGTFLPGIEKGWSCGMLINLQDTGYGRKAMSGAWAGLSNQYYWIDPTTGILGFMMGSICPFFDRDVCDLFEKFERVAYGSDLEGDNLSGFKIGL